MKIDPKRRDSARKLKALVQANAALIAAIADVLDDDAPAAAIAEGCAPLAAASPESVEKKTARRRPRGRLVAPKDAPPVDDLAAHRARRRIERLGLGGGGT